MWVEFDKNILDNSQKYNKNLAYFSDKDFSSPTHVVSIFVDLFPNPR